MAERSSNRRNPWMAAAGLAVAYIAAAKLGLALSVAHGNVTPVWAPTGISLAALLLFGIRLWPGIAIGAFIANVTTPIPMWAAGAICVGNTLEAVTGAYLLRRFANFDTALERVKDVLNLVLYGAVISAAIAATIGTTALFLADDVAHYGFSWQLWWHGDAMGDLLVAPLLLAWGTAIRRRNGSPSPLEEVALVTGLSIAGAIVFFGGVWRYPYILFPFFVWAALRFKQRGATTASFIVAALAVWGILTDHVPIGGITKTTSVEVFQTLLGGLALTSLILAASLSEKEKGRKEIERSLSLLQATLDSTTDGILVVDREGRIVSLNQRFAEMWNLPPEVLDTGLDDDAIAYVIDQLVDPDNFVARIRELYSHPESESYDYLEFKDGRTFERFSQAQLHDGVPVGRVWSFRDVTERRRLEEARSRFINHAVHELRNPVAALTGMAELATTRRDELTEDQLDDILEKVGKQGSRLSQLVTRMLDLGRIEASAARSELRAVDVRNLVDEVIEAVPTPPGKSVRSNVSDGTRVMADAGSLEQVLVNLLTNAYRYGGDDIVIDARGEGERVELSVFDNGPGIDRDLQPLLFEPFHRGKHKAIDGFGLGLAIVRTLVNGMGGQVDYDAADEGSRFRVTLPAPA